MFVPGGVDRCLDADGRKKRLTRGLEDDATNRNEEEDDENTRTAKFTFDATTRVPRDADAAILTKIHVDGRFRFERAMNVFGGESRGDVSRTPVGVRALFRVRVRERVRAVEGIDSDCG